MPADNWEGQLISAEEFDRLEDLYRPLAQSVRDLIDATVRTGADEATIRAAAEAIQAVTETLKPLSDQGWQGIRHADTGRPILFTNPAAGGRNPVAPPMVIRHDADGRCWSDFTLGAPYEGPPGMVHGGISALVLDHLLGEAASGGLTKPRFTGSHQLEVPAGNPVGCLARRGPHRPRAGTQDLCARLHQRCTGPDGRGRGSVHHTGVGQGQRLGNGHNRMKFYVSSAFLDTDEIVEIARAADELGYEGHGDP